MENVRTCIAAVPLSFTVSIYRAAVIKYNQQCILQVKFSNTLVYRKIQSCNWFFSKLDCAEISSRKEVISDFSHILCPQLPFVKKLFSGVKLSAGQLTWTGSKTPSLSREIGGRFSLKFKPLSDVPATAHGSPCW